jgi:hypothetical protein
MTGKNRESSAAISNVLYHRFLIYGVGDLRVTRASDAEAADEDQGGATFTANRRIAYSYAPPLRTSVIRPNGCIHSFEYGLLEN